MGAVGEQEPCEVVLGGDEVTARPSTPMAWIAKRIVVGRRRRCEACRVDLGETHEQFCSEGCAAEYRASSAY